MNHNIKITKTRDHNFGKFAEQTIAEHYVAKGYAILERNWRLGNKIEIDIIAQRDNIVAFVEVKARSGNDMDAADAVSRDKMKRMVRGSEVYLSSLKGEHEYRYDIATLTGDFNNYEIEIFEDAFLAPDLF